MTQTWNGQDRVLVSGDILRMKVFNKEHPKKGQYAYGFCSGEGFGCDPNKVGRAIYLDYSSYSLDKVLQFKHTGKVPEPIEKFNFNVLTPHGLVTITDGDLPGGERWNRDGSIEYLVEETPPVEAIQA